MNYLAIYPSKIPHKILITIRFCQDVTNSCEIVYNLARIDPAKIFAKILLGFLLGYVVFAKVEF